MGYLFLITALLLNVCANMLLKIGSANVSAWREVGVVSAFITNYPLVGGLMLFATNIIFYTLALTRLPLSVASPVMAAGGMVLIVLLSALVLSEHITLSQWLGISLLVLGIYFVVQR